MVHDIHSSCIGHDFCITLKICAPHSQFMHHINTSSITFTDCATHPQTAQTNLRIARHIHKLRTSFTKMRATFTDSARHSMIVQAFCRSPFTNCPRRSRFAQGLCQDRLALQVCPSTCGVCSLLNTTTVTCRDTLPNNGCLNSGLAGNVCANPLAKHVCPVTCSLCGQYCTCLLYTSPSPRDMYKSRMPSSA